MKSTAGTTSAAIVLAVVTPLGACSPQTPSTPNPQPAASAPAAPADPSTPAKPLDWKSLESPLLSDHIQLTSRDQFIRAGEAYFDHNSPPRWVIFQAVPVPAAGKDPDAAYSMYVARLNWNGERLTGIDHPIKISPEGSANTCGWFDPASGYRVIFGSTLTPPGNTQRPGFQVGTRKYIWMFPHEMEIVSRTIPEVYYSLHRDSPQPQWTGDATTAKPLFTRPNYDAECSFSKDGRFILYAHVRDEPTHGKDDADIWVFDTQTNQQHELIHADGYDGGPFWSPDNKRICYRSDRVGNDLLQLFVADLKFDSQGIPIGIEREHQVTSNEHVNWAPYWHPSGKFLIYGTSQESHANYEVFAVEVPEASDSAKPANQLRNRRITHATGADVLPVFSDDGKFMMWTAQRGPKAEGEEKPSSQVWVAKFHMPYPDELDYLFGIGAKKRSRQDAIAEMTALLARQESTELPRPGSSRYDLSGLKVERFKLGWRAVIDPIGAPDNTQYFIVMDDGRVLHGWLNANPGKDVWEMLNEPAAKAE